MAKRIGKKPTMEKADNKSGSQEPFMTIRHYCQGLGDCHLIRIRRAGMRDFFMLIDCGVHSSVRGGSDIIEAIVTDILDVTREIDVLVVTHEHVDHVSGFLSAAEKFAQIRFGEVWMGWTENPGDPQAQQLDRFKAQALALLGQASQRLAGTAKADSHMAAIGDGIASILGFNFGLKGERVRAMRDAAARLGSKPGPNYLEPGSIVSAIEGLDDLRIYVLGPPREAAKLKITERASEIYALAGAAPLMAALQGALALNGGQMLDDPAAPFDYNVGLALDAAFDGTLAEEAHAAPALAFLQAHYSGELPKPLRKKRQSKAIDANLSDQSWRRIDQDWLAMSSTLAMQLDDQTNNTSLVLAFENISTGRIMLLAADAQIGSWLSWQDLHWDIGTKQVTGKDILARTVYYKVAHHGSENATARTSGLELMVSPDLSAFIPTNQADAKRVRWREMPFPGIVEALMRKTSGRVVRADDDWLGTGQPPQALQKPTGSILAMRNPSRLWVEFDLA